MITKAEMTEAIVLAKAKKNTTWSAISKAVGLSEVYTTSACLGQNSLPPAYAEKLTSFLELGTEVKVALQAFPLKGTGQKVPTDPLIYRFFEISYIYGSTIKEIIHEKMGDGIMSAIDFSLDVEKVEDPKGDRVKVIMNGKFLPYKKW